MEDLVMRLELDVEELRQAVALLKQGLACGKTDLMSSLFFFEVNNVIRGFSANAEMWIETEIKYKKCEGVMGKTFSVMGSKIEELVGVVASDVMVMEIDGENLKVEAGYLTLNFQLYSGETLKVLRDKVTNEKGDLRYSVPVETLLEAMVCAKACQNTVYMRPEIAHSELRNGEVLASDGRKIMVYSAESLEKHAELKVPVSAANGVMGALKALKGETIHVTVGSSYYCFENDIYRQKFGVRKVERKFPEVRKKLEKVKIEDTASIDKHSLQAMLDGVGLSLEEEEQAVYLELTGAGKTASLEVWAKNTLGRKSFEKTPCGRVGSGDISVPVSIKHLESTISVFKGDSVVDIEISTANEMLVVVDKTESREVKTLIPFRTPKMEAEDRKEREKAKKASGKKDEGGDFEGRVEKKELKVDLEEVV